MGNGLACLSAAACQLHFRKSSGSGAAFRNVLKRFQGMYKISKIISGATTTELSTSGPSQAGGVSQQKSCEIQGGSMQTPGPLREKPCKGGGWGWLGWGAALWESLVPWGIMCHSGASRHQTWPIHASGDWITPSTLHCICSVWFWGSLNTKRGQAGVRSVRGPPGCSGLEQFPMRRG